MPAKTPPLPAAAAPEVSEKMAIPLPLTRPTTVPAMPITSRGMSLMTVMDTWSFPDSRGARELMTTASIR